MKHRLYIKVYQTDIHGDDKSQHPNYITSSTSGQQNGERNSKQIQTTRLREENE